METNRRNDYVTLPNPHLSDLAQDRLFHINVRLDKPETIQKFSNVKFVCIGGTSGRVRMLAEKLARELNLGKSNAKSGDASTDDPFDCMFCTERYSGFKVGPVFCVNHGMGMPSVSIMLHEVFKLLQAARCSDVTLIRIGTCGGIGLEPGTVVISSGSLTAGYEEVYVTSRLGQPLELPITVDQELVEEIRACASNDIRVTVGKTYCSEDFYQGQGRLDGSFCDYGKQEQLQFFDELRNRGVCNIEMESAAVLAMANKVNVKAAVVCVVLVNRLLADVVSMSPDELRKVEEFPLELVTRFIKKRLCNDS